MNDMKGVPQSGAHHSQELIRRALVGWKRALWLSYVKPDAELSISYSGYVQTLGASYLMMIRYSNYTFSLHQRLKKRWHNAVGETVGSDAGFS